MRWLIALATMALALAVVAQVADDSRSGATEVAGETAAPAESHEGEQAPEQTEQQSAASQDAKSSEAADEVEKPPVDAYAEVADIMSHLCMECHGDPQPAAGFPLPSNRQGSGMVGVPSTQRTDLQLIDLESPDESYFLMKLRGDPGILGQPMPMARKLTEGQLEMFELWVYELAGVEPVAEQEENGKSGEAADADAAGDDQSDEDGKDESSSPDDGEPNGDGADGSGEAPGGSGDGADEAGDAD